MGSCGDASSPPGASPPPAKSGTPPIDPSIFPQPGSTEFTTANANELLSDGTEGQSYGRGTNAAGALAEDSGAAGGKGTSPPAPGPEPEPTPDPTREIVEADVYKLEGNLL